MQNIKQVSCETLSELSCLLGRISNLIDKDFCHVSEFINPSLFTAIATETERINKEWERREELTEIEMNNY